MSNIVNKVKDALSGHKDTEPTTTSNTTSTHNPNHYSASTNAGPHDSNIANKMDPRVDSDRDGSYTAGNTYPSGQTHLSSAGTGMTAPTGTMGTTGGYGPHSSGMANRADPFVDSTTGTTSHSTHTGTGIGTTGSGYTHSTNAGPHNSNLGNKLDPRVDSDRDGSYRTGGVNTSTGTGMTGTSGGLTGTGPAPTTAGPHKSDMMNKVDPRVDSDLDGSRTVGQGPKYGNY